MRLATTTLIALLFVCLGGTAVAAGPGEDAALFRLVATLAGGRDGHAHSRRRRGRGALRGAPRRLWPCATTARLPGRTMPPCSTRSASPQLARRSRPPSSSRSDRSPSTTRGRAASTCSGARPIAGRRSRARSSTDSRTGSTDSDGSSCRSETLASPRSPRARVMPRSSAPASGASRRCRREGADSNGSSALETSFTSSVGLRFSATLQNLGGRRAVSTSLSRPPESTEQIFHIDKFLERERPTKIAFPAEAAGLRRLSVGSFGELDVRTLLAVVGAPRVDATGSGWAGGRTAIYGGGGSSAALVVLAWDTSADADEWARAVPTYLGLALGSPDAKPSPCEATMCWQIGTRGIAFVHVRQEHRVGRSPATPTGRPRSRERRSESADLNLNLRFRSPKLASPRLAPFRRPPDQNAGRGYPFRVIFGPVSAVQTCCFPQVRLVERRCPDERHRSSGGHLRARRKAGSDDVARNLLTRSWDRLAIAGRRRLPLLAALVVILTATIGLLGRCRTSRPVRRSARLSDRSARLSRRVGAARPSSREGRSRRARADRCRRRPRLPHGQAHARPRVDRNLAALRRRCQPQHPARPGDDHRRRQARRALPDRRPARRSTRVALEARHQTPRPHRRRRSDRLPRRSRRDVTPHSPARDLRRRRRRRHTEGRTVGSRPPRRRHVPDARARRLGALAPVRDRSRYYLRHDERGRLDRDQLGHRHRRPARRRPSERRHRRDALPPPWHQRLGHDSARRVDAAGLRRQQHHQRARHLLAPSRPDRQRARELQLGAQRHDTVGRRLGSLLGSRLTRTGRRCSGVYNNTTTQRRSLGVDRRRRRRLRRHRPVLRRRRSRRHRQLDERRRLERGLRSPVG